MDDPLVLLSRIHYYKHVDFAFLLLNVQIKVQFLNFTERLMHIIWQIIKFQREFSSSSRAAWVQWEHLTWWGHMTFFFEEKS